jgi:hypothetical protein
MVFDRARTALRESLSQLEQTIKDETERDQVVKAIEDLPVADVLAPLAVFKHL